MNSKGGAVNEEQPEEELWNGSILRRSCELTTEYRASQAVTLFSHC